MNKPAVVPFDADPERRFSGLRRLYGDAGYTLVRQARVAVVGLGGVGSWAAEALARSGVAALVLIDLDHVSESNINRQVQALGSTVGQAKGEALALRIQDIHPGCVVQVVDAFVEADNWPALLPHAVDVLIDACDQVRAKLVLAQWGLAERVPVVCVGAAGGKHHPQLVEVADLSLVTHDPLLASLRQRLRKAVLPETGPLASLSTSPSPGPSARSSKGPSTAGNKVAPVGLPCVFSREPVAAPKAGESTNGWAVQGGAEGAGDGSLNCHGYGSSVTVTATFGMVAAAQALNAVVNKPTGQATTPGCNSMLEPKNGS
jgi:tRNA threonylcarbamoyladenosine dehydratase